MKTIILTLKKLFNHQVFRFLIVGFFCAFQNIFLLYFFKEFLHLHYLVSIIILSIVVNSIGFYLNRRYTFQNNNNQFWKEFIKYHTVMLSSYLTVSISMYVLVDIFNIWYLSAFLIMTVVITIYNFALHKKWTFK
ncbi:MAG: GtrA family protein [Xenococcaceae cyanobacterium]